VIDQSRDCGRARPFRQSLFALQQQKNGIRNLFFFHGDNVVYIFLDQRQSAVSRAPDSNAISDGRRRRERYRFAFCYGEFHGGQARGLYSENLNFGIGLFKGAGDAAYQATTADRDNHCFKVRMLLEEFKTNRALPGDNRVIVEGVDKSQVLRVTAAKGFFECFIVVGAMQDDVGTISAGCGNLDERRGQGHANLSSDAEFAGVIGHPLSVISRRSGNYSLSTFFGG